MKNENFFIKNMEMSFFFCNFVAGNDIHLKKTFMKEPNRILFISQEIYPFLATETPIRVLNRQLPEFFQASGYETRTFMPKFGEINERRNQLHEVIRLSGMNIIIEDTDHPLLIKVTSIQSARIQIYFIDNEDYFQRRRGIADADGNEYADNDERCIFFARGVLETVRKLRWTPNIVHCSGWMAALAIVYLKKAYADSPFFEHSKIVLALDDNEYHTPFGTNFTQKLLLDGMVQNDVRTLAGFPVGYEELMRLAIDYADAVMVATPQVNQRLMNYAEMRDKPIFVYRENGLDEYKAFCENLMVNSKEE